VALRLPLLLQDLLLVVLLVFPLARYNQPERTSKPKTELSSQTSS
jgi:hypothetical protein